MMNENKRIGLAGMFMGSIGVLLGFAAISIPQQIRKLWAVDPRYFTSMGIFLAIIGSIMFAFALQCFLQRNYEDTHNKNDNSRQQNVRKNNLGETSSLECGSRPLVTESHIPADSSCNKNGERRDES